MKVDGPIEKERKDAHGKEPVRQAGGEHSPIEKKFDGYYRFGAALTLNVDEQQEGDEGKRESRVDQRVIPRNDIATRVQAEEKENQGRDERCRAKKVDTLECRFGRVFDWNMDCEEYYDTGDDSKWYSRNPLCQQGLSSIH